MGDQCLVAATGTRQVVKRRQAASRKHEQMDPHLGHAAEKYEALVPRATAETTHGGVPVNARADVAALHTRDVWARYLRPVRDEEASVASVKTVASRAGALGKQ